MFQKTIFAKVQLRSRNKIKKVDRRIDNDNTGKVSVRRGPVSQRHSHVRIVLGERRVQPYLRKINALKWRYVLDLGQ